MEAYETPVERLIVTTGHETECCRTFSHFRVVDFAKEQENENNVSRIITHVHRHFSSYQIVRLQRR